MRPIKLTSEVARENGWNYYTVFNCIRHGRIKAPAKTASGQYAWDDGDIEAVRHVLAQRRPRRHKKGGRVA